MRAALARGLTVVLDVHHFGAYDADRGAWHAPLRDALLA